MLKRIMLLGVAFLLFAPQVSAAQDPTSEPGPGAVSELPDASVLGEEWTRYAVVSPDVLGRYSFEMTPDVFNEGAAGLYSGPNGSRVVIVNLIVTDSRVAVRASWEDATDLLDQMTWSADYDYRRIENLDTMPPPTQCVEAKRFEGVENTYLTPIGATMCAQDPDNVWIFQVSGSLYGVTGIEASDALVEMTLGSSSIGADATIAATSTEPTQDRPTEVTAASGIDYDSIRADGRFLGDPEAPVNFVIYSDFQCPFCQQFNDVDLPLIVENFVEPGYVRIEWRPMPIISGIENIALEAPENESVQASEAAMCAADQGAFWPYSEALFQAQGAENSGVYSDDMLKETAADLGLDTTSFNDCLDTGEKQDEVVAIREDGVERGVSGTPTFLINDQLVNYTAQGYDRLEDQLNDALAGNPIANLGRVIAREPFATRSRVAAWKSLCVG